MFVFVFILGTITENELSPQAGRAFTTKDQDNDGNYLSNLAQFAHGGWWYNMDSTPNLCGWYCHATDTARFPGCTHAMNWGWVSPLKRAEMKIRRVITANSY